MLDERTDDPKRKKLSFKLVVPIADPTALPANEVTVLLRYHIQIGGKCKGWVGGRLRASVQNGSATQDMIGGTGRLRFTTMYVGTDWLRAEGKLVVSAYLQKFGDLSDHCPLSIDLVQIE